MSDAHATAKLARLAVTSPIVHGLGTSDVRDSAARARQKRHDLVSPHAPSAEVSIGALRYG